MTTEFPVLGSVYVTPTLPPPKVIFLHSSVDGGRVISSEYPYCVVGIPEWMLEESLVRSILIVW